jgi:hypothetical protein
MRSKLGFGVLILGSVISLVGCAAPPTAQIDAAKAALEKATAADAANYAPDSLKAAQDAGAALDAEMAVQNGRFLKSWIKVNDLATVAEKAGRDAATDAEIGKVRAKTAATNNCEEAKKAITEAEDLLAKAPKGKGSAADIQAMKADLTSATTTIGEAETALGSGRLLDAKAKSESALKTANGVKTAVEEAMAAKKKG